MHIFNANFVALFFFSFLCCDSSYAVKAPGYNTDLKIHQDGIMQDQKTLQVYTSVVRYSSHTAASLNKERLAGLTKQAFAEMQQAHDVYVNDCKSQGDKKKREMKRPTMISAIAIGNEVYFSSPLKGNAPSKNILLQNENARLSIALQQCRASTWGNELDAVPAAEVHRTNGNCGEIMAAALHVKVQGELPWDRQSKENLKPPVMVAYGTPGKVKGVTPTIQNPCWFNEKKVSNPKNIGCSQFVEWQKWDYAKEDQKLDFVDVPEDPQEYVDVDLSDVWRIEDVGARDPLHSA